MKNLIIGSKTYQDVDKLEVEKLINSTPDGTRIFVFKNKTDFQKMAKLLCV
jgi:hypothetical protein